MPSFIYAHDETPPWAIGRYIDMIAAFDDQLTARFAGCAVCAQRTSAESGRWVARTAWGVLCLAFALCGACVRRLAHSLRALDRLLCGRYGVEDDG